MSFPFYPGHHNDHYNPHQGVGGVFNNGHLYGNNHNQQAVPYYGHAGGHRGYDNHLAAPYYGHGGGHHGHNNHHADPYYGHGAGHGLGQYGGYKKGRKHHFGHHGHHGGDSSGSDSD